MKFPALSSGPRCGRIVEFVGLPGSGKSTVSHAVAEILRGTREPVSERSFEIAHRAGPTRRRLAKGRLAVRAVLRHPWAVLALGSAIARTGQRRWREAAGKTLDLLYVCGLVAERSRRPGVHLMDQGFFSGLFSICFGASSAVPLERLVAAGTKCCGGPPADLVTVLDVPAGIAVERLKGRRGAASRLERSIATARFERDLHAAIVSLRQVREVLAAHDRAWRVRVVTGGASREVDSLAAEITEAILGSVPAVSPPRTPEEAPCG